jgi:2-polyprenyl-3-methyl-5-hydroxy-6-metoxy-1,4-benzoquinol methylase
MDPTATLDATPGDVETVDCPVCRGTITVPYYAGPDRAHDLPGWFLLVRCTTCDTVFQNPRPTARALARYYPPDYFPYAAAPRRSLAQRLGWRHGYELYRRCRFVRQHAAGGSLLDVGCATGTFLSAIRDFGAWQVWGIELSLGAARQARARGLDVVVARFEDIQLAAGSLDAVTLWDVLEHLPDPVDALGQIRAALRPGGHVFLNVPALDGWDARLFGAYWCGLDLPRHLTLFDRASMTRALAAAGLEAVAMGYPTGSHYSVTQSTRQLLAAHAAPGNWAATLAKLTEGPLAHVALAPYGWLAEGLGHGASLTVAARRPE